MRININELQGLIKELENELFGSVIPFWEKYSPDWKNGGYYNCLDRDGTVYDTTKHVWLQARQIWMFSKLYRTVEPKAEWLKLAQLGMDFLEKHALTREKRVYFSLSEDGRPIYLQRKLFSECFYTMALSEYGRATGRKSYIGKSREMLSLVLELAVNPERLGRNMGEGASANRALAIPMIILNLLDEVISDECESNSRTVQSCIDAVKLHFHGDRVYETIGKNGNLLPGFEGRVQNPGHAMEAGWFLLHTARKLSDKDLSALAVKMIDNSCNQGWDQKYGGIFYFIDAGGFSPVQLEWDMKLWWVHAEAMYAQLLCYMTHRQDYHWKAFINIKNFIFTHFRDPEHGEWYGYLNRHGEVTHRFKGGPYKGFFHVPRALLFCLFRLKELHKEYSTQPTGDRT